MFKKFTLPILIMSIVVQLLVPDWMISYGNKAEEDLQEYGREFKIPVYIQSIYNGSMDVRFYEYNLFQIGHYAVLQEDENGYANLMQTQSTKPKTSDYIYVTSENKLKLGEDYKIDADITSWSVGEKSAYLVIKVYNGELEIVGLYMDGVPAEEWFETAIVSKNEYDKDVLIQP